MPATGLEISRRAFALVCAAAVARAADPAQDALDLITRLAGFLASADATQFLDACDSRMPSYSDLRVNVSALVAQAEVESGIDPVRNEGDAAARDLEVDWSLRLVGRAGFERVTSRQGIVKLRLEKKGRSWKVVGLAPVAFFAPPSA
jgi:hypothetical protein